LGDSKAIDSTLSMNCIGVLAHPLRPQTHPIASQIQQTIQSHGIETWMYTRWQENDVREDVQRADMVVAIGGDGAMLRAARVCAPYEVAVLGINMGQLGFLTEIADPQQWEAQFAQLLTGDYWIEERSMIRADVYHNERGIGSGHALNDIVVSGGSVGKMMELETYIDGHWTTTYYADALVVSTATGATGYALSLGGPILPPELNNILLVPAAPHLSLDRAIVLSEGSMVEIVASGINAERWVVTGDGVTLCELNTVSRVQIQLSEYSSRFVRLRGRNYFYRSLLERLEPRVSRPGNRNKQEDSSDG